MNGYEEEYGLNLAEQAGRDEQAKRIADADAAEAAAKSIMGDEDYKDPNIPTDPITGLPIPEPGGPDVSGAGTLMKSSGLYSDPNIWMGSTLLDPIDDYEKIQEIKNRETKAGLEAELGKEEAATVMLGPHKDPITGEQSEGILNTFLKRMDKLGIGTIPGSNTPLFRNIDELRSAYGGISDEAILASLEIMMANLPTEEEEADRVRARAAAIEAGETTYINPITAAVENVGELPDSLDPDLDPDLSTAEEGDDDWTDEDFTKAWSEVNDPSFNMANIGKYLKVYTPKIQIGDELVSGTPVMTTRSKELLNRAASLESQKKNAEQQVWDRKIQTAQTTGKFGDEDTLAKKQQDYDERVANAQLTGYMDGQTTLAKDKLDLERAIVEADQTGYFTDPTSATGQKSKTLTFQKFEQEKKLADAQADLQIANVMGRHPQTGQKTFAKQQWADQFGLNEKEYDEKVAARIGAQNQSLLALLGTSLEGAYVKDENNIIKRDAEGNPILQTLAARELTENIIQQNLDRATVNKQIAELVRSNQENEKIRLIELGYNEEEATTLADRRLAAQIRSEKANEDLRDKELELKRDLQAGQMDFQMQQLASQNLALMLQNPAAFGALTALTGGGMPQQLQGLGMQLPTAQQPGAAQQTGAPQQPGGAQFTPQQAISQMFQGSIPTMGQLGELDPQAMQTLTSMLGYSAGIRPEQLGRASAGVTPGGMQAPPAQVFSRGLPTGRRV